MAKKPTMEAAMLAATAVLALTRKQRDAVEKMLVDKRRAEDERKLCAVKKEYQEETPA